MAGERPLPEHVQAPLAQYVVTQLRAGGVSDDIAGELLLVLLALVAGEACELKERNRALKAKGDVLVDLISEGGCDVAAVLASGTEGLGETLREEEERRLRARADVEARHATISAHHAALRGGAEAEATYAAGVADSEALRRYASAAYKVADSPWAQAGFEWCREQCRLFFEQGGAAQLEERRSRRLRRGAGGDAGSVRELGPSQVDAVPCAGRRQLRLLDIGSCGSHFEAWEELAPLALDLCPARPNVYQCDFLELSVASANAPLSVEQSACGAPSKLLELPAASFDVAVLSKVLSYLPLASQRGAMVAKARALLTHPGLLLIVDVESVDKSPGGRLLKEWRAPIEAMGFERWRYVRLDFGQHALAFATTSAEQPVVAPASLPIRADFRVGIGAGEKSQVHAVPVAEDVPRELGDASCVDLRKDG